MATNNSNGYGYRALDGDTARPHFGKLGAIPARWLADNMPVGNSERTRRYWRLALECYSNMYDRGDEPPAFKIGYRALAQDAETTERQAQSFFNSMEGKGLIVRLGPANGRAIWRTFACFVPEDEPNRYDPSTGSVKPNPYDPSTGSNPYDASTGSSMNRMKAPTGSHKKIRISGSAPEAPAAIRRKPIPNNGTVYEELAAIEDGGGNDGQ